MNLLRYFQIIIATLMLTPFMFLCYAQQGGGSAGNGAAHESKGAAHGASLKAKPGNDTLIIMARLVEIPGKFPPNDLYNYVYVMKYRVIKVLKGAYANKEILVGHYNPLVPRKQIKDKMSHVVKGDVAKFEVNAKHRLVLVHPIERVWKDAVEDEYTDSDLEKYFALRADGAK